MKKALIAVAIFSGIIIVPCLGMAIAPTRDALLGLAPEEAILKLADKIDETRLDVDQNKTDSDSKIQELQSVIDGQQAKLMEQQQIIDSQSGQINSVKIESQAIQTKVNREAECRKLYSDNPECKSSNKIYWTKAVFDDFIDDEKDNHNASDSDIEGYKRKFSTCQSIIAKCE